jgi:hypothetical protein
MQGLDLQPTTGAIREVMKRSPAAHRTEPAPTLPQIFLRQGQPEARDARIIGAGRGDEAGMAASILCGRTLLGSRTTASVCAPPT